MKEELEEKTKGSRASQKVTKRTVFIQLREIHGDNLPEEIVADSKKSLSPTFNGQTRLVNKGLTEEEEKNILPKVLGVPYNSPDYHKKAEDFWNSLTVVVTYSEGLKLDISDIDGEPINPKDYIIYKRALVSPNVAKSKALSKSDKRFWFYIYDPDEEKLNTNSKVKKKTEAVQLFTKHSDDSNSMDLLVWMMGSNPHNMDAAEKENFVFSYCTTNPEEFIKLCKDNKLKLKAEIYSGLYHQVLRKVGNTYVYIDTNLGDSLEDACMFIEDPKNSSITNSIRQQLKARK